MLKVKHERECDCVVAGFRWHKDGEGTRGRLAAARALRRRGRAPARRRLRELHRREAPRARRVSRAVPRERARRTTPGRRGREWQADGRRAGSASPARAKPLEPGQGPVVGAAAPRARRRGRLRSHAGHALPPHGAVPPLAHRQAAARLHVRAARGRGAAGVARRSSARVSALLLRPLTPLARRIVVGVGRFLRRADRFGHVAQVHANARPRRRAAAHRVDENVVDRELRRRFRMLRFPALEPGERRVLLRRVRDRDERHLRLRAPPPRRRLRALCARRRDARRFAVRLSKVRRPRRVAETRRLVACRELEQRIRATPTASSISACGSPIVRETRRHREHREVAPDRSPAPRSNRAASTRARRAAAEPNTPSTSCGPWRSGCSRGRRRAALPSTTSTSRAPARAARSRARTRAPRAALR